MRQSARAHYVGHNAVTRVPRSFVYLDTETFRERHHRSEMQRFRLAVAAFDTKSHKGDGWAARRWTHATDTRALWEWITERCRPKARTVLVAHNLSFDLRISNAFVELPALGFRFRAGRVDDGQAWMIWSDGARTLAMVDSLSWVPLALERLGELVGIRKLDLPRDDDDEPTWFARCERDVEILADVWRRLMLWVEDDDLGNWKLSGAGQAWAAFRHRFMTDRLLVHEDDDARAAERHAAHTGRCEAWQHGKLSGGPFVEWDFETAYARIGAECDVPTKLCGVLAAPSIDKVLRLSATRAVLVECEVTTDVPTLPTRTATGICWPTGRFSTFVWEQELEIARRHGARVDVQRAWVYRRAPALQAFCRWVLDGIDGTGRDEDPIVRVALKHWSRALIGRTAAQWSRWETWGRASTSGVGLGRAHDASAGERFELLQLGTQLLRQTGRPENPDAMVAIMSWVMAESRVRLWGAMEAAGFEHVLYVDTDSLIVDPEGDRRLAAQAIPGLRVKGEWESLRVLGPRQLIPGAQLRAAGVPRRAVQVGPATWEGEVWSGLSRSLRTGAADSVEVARRTFTVNGNDKRRIHLAHHLTAPHRMSAAAVELPA